MLLQQIQESVREVLTELALAGEYRQYAGTYSAKLAEQLSQRLGVSECLLSSSGTAALEIALRAAGIGSGDAVILSGYDYPGNFWAIERAGARPVVIDTEDHGWQLDFEQLDVAVSAGSSRKCRALVASHLHGQLQNARQLRAWCDAHEMLYVEDACQAIGATTDGSPAGTHGHVGILSFGGGKVLSAGRGGALVTSNASLGQKARIAAGAGSGPYAMSELQAAVVLAQLNWLERVNQQCRRFFADVNEHLIRKGAQHLMPGSQSLPDTCFYQAGWLDCRSAVQQPPAQELQQGKEAMIDALRLRGIPAGNGFPGSHRRSSRRCQRVGNLGNVASVVERTWVIHHSVALEERISSESVAEAIATASSH